MVSLLIETATEKSLVALVDENEVLYVSHMEGYGNSAHLLPEIDRAFKTLQMSPMNLSLIAAGVGPGSYTGIRVGAVTAKTFSYATKVPLIGICSLEGFVPDEDGSFAAIVDAKIGGVYLFKGTKKEGNVIFEGQPGVYELDKLEAVLRDTSSLVTPNSAILRQKIENLYPRNSWKWLEKFPDPLEIAKRAQMKFKLGEYTIDGKLKLLYLRKTQAEMEKEKELFRSPEERNNFSVD